MILKSLFKFLLLSSILFYCNNTSQTEVSMSDYKIIFYSEENFTGTQLVLEGKDVPNLIDWNYNDSITSAEVIKGNWTLYNAVGYQDIKWNVYENGGPNNNGKYPSYKDWNGANNWISSVRRGIY